MSSTIIKPSGKLNPWVFTSSFNLAYDAHFDADKVHQELWDSLCDRTLVLRCPWYELVNIEIFGINAQWGWKHPSESFGRNHQFRSRGAKFLLPRSEKINRSRSPGAPERLPKHSRERFFGPAGKFQFGLKTLFNSNLKADTKRKRRAAVLEGFKKQNR